MNKSFEEQLAFGTSGEFEVLRWLQLRGASVFPAAQVITAPHQGARMTGERGEFIAPDLLASYKGITVWIEVKRKNQATFYRKTQRWVTGIDLYSYQQYQRIAEETGIPVKLYFLQEQEPAPSKYNEYRPSPTGVYAVKIGDILPRIEERSTAYYGKKGMVYWELGQLEHVATLETFKAAVAAGNY